MYVNDIMLIYIYKHCECVIHKTNRKNEFTYTIKNNLKKMFEERMNNIREWLYNNKLCGTIVFNGYFKMSWQSNENEWNNDDWIKLFFLYYI